MDWITEQIAIGNYLDASDPVLLGKSGIKSTLCLDCELALPDVAVTRHVVHLNDAPGNELDTYLRAVTTLERLIVDASPVLVHCHAGRSRSVVVVAGVLMRAQGCTPEGALAQVAAKREIAVTRGVEQLLYYIWR